MISTWRINLHSQLVRDWLDFLLYNNVIPKSTTAQIKGVLRIGYILVIVSMSALYDCTDMGILWTFFEYMTLMLDII